MNPRKPNDADPATLIAICLPAMTGPDVPDPAALICSFCGKPRAQVQALFAGRGVYICNECVTLCAEILAEPDAQA
jgi:hypothetical protein